MSGISHLGLQLEKSDCRHFIGFKDGKAVQGYVEIRSSSTSVTKRYFKTCGVGSRDSGELTCEEYSALSGLKDQGSYKTDTCYGNFSECACMPCYDRNLPENIRDQLDTTIIDWCKANNRTEVKILSLASGHLLQELILARKCEAEGIKVVFIAIDHKYSTDIFTRGARIRKRDGSEKRNISGSLCDLPISFPGSIHTYHSLQDYVFCLEQKKAPLPDLLFTIDFLEGFKPELFMSGFDERELWLNAKLGDNVYDIAFQQVHDHDAGKRFYWHNFVMMLASSGLLQHRPQLTSIVAANGIIKTFCGVDEIKCFNPATNKIFGIDDSEPEILKLTDDHIDFDKTLSCLPRRIIISPINANLRGTYNFEAQNLKRLQSKVAAFVSPTPEQRLEKAQLLAEQQAAAKKLEEEQIKAEQERIAREIATRLEAERIREQERIARETAARIDAERIKAEQERIARETAARLEAERIAAEQRRIQRLIERRLQF